MRTEPVFSVIVIFYNAEKFLREAIDSVFAQTEKSWELQLVDDGSIDGSSRLARQYANLWPEKVHYLRHPDCRNHGMSATRNLGIRNSRGQWIAFLDADDIWLPTKLAEQRALSLAHPTAGLLYGSPLYWHSWSEEFSQSRDFQPGISVPPNTLVHPPKLMLLNHPLGNGSAPCPSDLIVTRIVLEQVGGFEESFSGIYQLYEDQAFLAKVYLVTPAFVSDQCWTRYRQSLSSCSAVTDTAGTYDEIRIFFLDYLERYLRFHKVKDFAVWRALRQAQWPYRHPHLSQMSHLFRAGLQWVRRFVPIL